MIYKTELNPSLDSMKNGSVLLLLKMIRFNVAKTGIKKFWQNRVPAIIFAQYKLLMAKSKIYATDDVMKKS